MTPRERVIIALDVPHLAALEGLLDRLDAGSQDGPVLYKVGLQLFIAEGTRAMEAVHRRGGRLFLDLKLHDIPNTVASAVRSAADRWPVEMMTLHAPGGRDMMEAAVAAAREADEDLKLLAVTVLTSLTGTDLMLDGYALEAGKDPAVAPLVRRRVGAAVNAGVHGVVCSPQEVAMVSSTKFESYSGPVRVLHVVPGIRPGGTAKDDQKRVATPADAIRNGADYLVVGRPIREAEDPAAAFRAIVAEVDRASGMGT